MKTIYDLERLQAVINGIHLRTFGENLGVQLVRKQRERVAYEVAFRLLAARNRK